MHTGMLYAADNIQQALLGVLRRVTSRGRLLKRSCTQDVVFSRLVEVCLASCAPWFDGEVSSTGVPPRLSAISVHASLCTQVLDAEVSGTAVPPRSSAKDWPRRCVPERLCLGVCCYRVRYGCACSFLLLLVRIPLCTAACIAEVSNTTVPARFTA